MFVHELLETHAHGFRAVGHKAVRHQVIEISGKFVVKTSYDLCHTQSITKRNANIYPTSVNDGRCAAEVVPLVSLALSTSR
jgi:hypothetical protein